MHQVDVIQGTERQNTTQKKSVTAQVREYNLHCTHHCDCSTSRQIHTSYVLTRLVGTAGCDRHSSGQTRKAKINIQAVRFYYALQCCRYNTQASSKLAQISQLLKEVTSSLHLRLSFSSFD